MIRTSAFLASAGLMAVATPAFAQTAVSNTDTDKQTAQPTPGATEGAATQDQAREQQPVDTNNIVITATRRNEALSDVPMAVSAVTAQTLEYTGATDIRQLDQVSPSLLVTSTQSEGGASTARIRGIGTVGDNAGLEGSVGIFIDGVYRSRAGMALTELGPLDRIEVLRGPQGTLFGRNTSAGLISIITAKPRFTPEVSGQVDVGNYDSRRVEASVTGPITDTIAARLDGVWFKRDGFLKDVISGHRVNDRNRWMLRGQALFQPSDNFSFRLIGDYTKRNEECCGAVFLPAFDTVRNPAGGTVRAPSTIAAIERGLGATIIDDPFKRDISITPGRNFNNRVKDGGISGEGVYDFGWAELTSISAWRYNKFTRGQDADYNDLDIWFRDDDGGSFNRFKTFTQELRLQGNAWDNRLDWLLGGYYANENLRSDDNITFGADYPRYSNCLIAANFVAGGSPASLLAPNPNPAVGNCFNPVVAPLVRAGLIQQFNATTNPTVAANIAGNITALGAFAQLNNPALVHPLFGPFVPAINFSGPPFGRSGLTNLAFILNPTNPSLLGQSIAFSGLDDSFRQKSNNFAIFTHNIFAITDELKLTVGARFTHEKKKLDAELLDNNLLCVALSGSALQTPACVIPGAPGGAFSLDDSRTENKVSGTAVLSWKPIDRLLTYASYSRGYKAGGFNLDRSALWRAQAIPTTVPATPGTAVLSSPPLSGSGAICVSPTQRGCQGIVASGADLQFKPETNDSWELGAKYNGAGFDVNVAVFYTLYKNFQLNTFNGLNFVVENVNSCKNSLHGEDTDNSSISGACDSDDVRAGVKNYGFELEAFTRPMRYLAVNAGVTMANSDYRKNLVGANGRALTAALFQLPGRRVSNAPKWTVTSSVAWTPPIGGSGMHGLVYADVRHNSRFNTGSDLDIEKEQGAFTVVNARLGLRGPAEQWGIEVWAQNLFDEDFKQIAFDAPIQGSGTTRGVERGAANGFYNRATQLYAAFLGEPRTFGLTLRGRLGFARERPVEYVPPPAPPPPPVVEQPAPPPPPPPPPPVEKGERG